MSNNCDAVKVRSFVTAVKLGSTDLATTDM